MQKSSAVPRQEGPEEAGSNEAVSSQLGFGKLGNFFRLWLVSWLVGVRLKLD